MPAVPQRSLQIQAPPPGLWPPTWPMGLTMLRLLLLPLFLWLLLIDAGDVGAPRPHRWWAIGVFAVMALTDKLDGYLARRLNQTSKIGTILDPVADKLLIACAIVLLSSRRVAPAGFEIPLYLVAIVYGKDLLVALGAVALLYLVGRVTVAPRWPGKLSTALQLALVLLTLMAPDLARAWPDTTRWFLRGLGWVIAALALVACVDYVAVGVRQLRAGRAGNVAETPS